MVRKGSWREVTQAVEERGRTVLRSSELDAGVKKMVAVAGSRGDGCRYCQAHIDNSAQKKNERAEKITAVFEFESNDLFSEKRERRSELQCMQLWHPIL